MRYMIEKIVESICNKQYNVDDHADEEKEKDNFLLQEVLVTIPSGK